MTAETMQAVVCHGPYDYRVEEVARPRPGPGEVLVKVGAAGICASDMKCYTGGALFWGENGKGGYCEAPVIAGHEFAGTVVALGEGASERHDVVVRRAHAPILRPAIPRRRLLRRRVRARLDEEALTTRAERQLRDELCAVTGNAVDL